MPQITGPLARREFRLYFVGNVFSNMGTWISNVALGVYMLNLTGSSLWVGLANAALFVPVLVVALPAGAWADRTDRLKLLARSQMFAGTFAAILTALVFLDAANRYAVLVLAAGIGGSLAVGVPSLQSLLPSLVPPEELPEAIGLNALTFNLARAAGPVLAAVAIGFAGAGWAFGLNAASYLALIAALFLIGRPPFLREIDGEPGRVRDGLIYAWNHRRTRTMLLAIVAMGASLDPITTLSPALAESYGLANGGAGWIVSAWGAGAALGATFGRSGIRYATKHGLGWAGLIVQAIGLVGLGMAPNLPAALPGALITGLGYIAATVVFTTTIQEDVPERLRGRVMALWTAAFLGPRVLSAVIDGALADAWGPHTATALFALPALIGAVWVRRVTPPRRIEPVAPAA